MEDNVTTLEQMRSEYQTLKETLAKQEIINDRLMRETMKAKVRDIRNTPIIAGICAALVMISAPVIFHMNPLVNASWWFIAATELLMAFCMCYDLIANRKVQKTDVSSCDLLTFAKSVKQLKERYRSWIKWGAPLGIAWLAWLIAEALMHSSEPDLTVSLVIGLVIGFAIGGFLGYKLNRRVVRNCDEIIAQIEE